MTCYFSVVITRPSGDDWVELLVKRQKRAGILGTALGQDSELADWAVATAREQRHANS